MKKMVKSSAIGLEIGPTGLTNLIDQNEPLDGPP